MAGGNTRGLQREIKTADRAQYFSRHPFILYDDASHLDGYTMFPPCIETQVDISQAASGELKVVCQNSKYARYLMEKLSAIKDKNGDGLVCFYGNSTEGRCCFYIAMVDQVRVGRQYAKKNIYGVFSSTQNGSDGHSFFALSLYCPKGAEGRLEICRLLGLKTYVSNEARYDCFNFKESSKRGNDSFYFHPDTLPFSQTSIKKKAARQEQEEKRPCITKVITIRDGLRHAFVTKKSEGEGPKQHYVETKRRIDFNLLFTTVMKITDPATHLTWKGGEQQNDEDKQQIIVRNGIAYRSQESDQKSDYESISLKWVTHEGILKLAVSYYSFTDQLFSPSQQQATYLITFNKDKSITTEPLSAPPLLGISTESNFNPKTDKHGPIPGSVFALDGSDVLDSLLEWGNVLSSKLSQSKCTEMETKSAGPLPEQSKRAHYALIHSLCQNDLLTVRSDYLNITKAIQQVALLYDRMLEGQDSNITLATYNKRLQAVLTILEILQNVEEDKEAGPDLAPREDLFEDDDESPRDKKSHLTPTEKQALANQFKIILDNDPPWQERPLLDNIIRGLLCITIVGILPVLFWNHSVYKNHVQSALDAEKEALAADKVSDFQVSGWKNWGLA